MYDPFSEFESTTLSNGLTVHALHRPEIPFAQIVILVHCGANDDPKGKSGIAHFLEHMICANSGKTLSQLRKYFANEGGSFLANTNHYRTCYGFMAPINSPKFDEFLAYWANATVVNPLVDYFESEQKIIRSEIARLFSSAQVMENRQTAHQLMFRGELQGQAFSSLGTKDSFEMIQLKDLHEQRRKMYVPQNMQVVCVGGLSLQDVVQKVNCSALSTVVKGRVNPILQKTTTVAPLIQSRYTGECHDAQKMGVTSLQKTFMLPGTASVQSADLAARVVSERLILSLREAQGLLYSANAEALKCIGYTLFHLSTPNFDAEHLGIVEQTISNVVANFCLDAAAFEEAKHQELVRYQTIDMNLASILKNAIADLVHHRRIISLADEHAASKSVKHSDMSKLSRYLTEDNMFTYVEHK
jgi:predicted Zn-dependent peptidase